MIKKNLLGAAIVLSLGFTGAAHAFSVDTGFGIKNNVGGFDWLPGSALGKDSLPLATFPGMTSFTVYSQASLSSYLDTGSGSISDSNLNSKYELTYVLGFGEIGTLTSVPNPFGQTAQFLFDSTNPINFFAVYYDSTPATFASSLAGTGYSDGDLILAGTIVNDDGGSNVTGGNFTINFTAPGLLDQNGVDNWAGKLTNVGGGTNKAVIDMTAQNQDRNFFNGLDISALTTLSILSSNATTPFTLTDPSHIVAGVPVSDLPTKNGDPTCRGAVGGSPCSFLFQNDGAQKLSTVPEPGSLALLGMGMLGAGLSRRKKSA